MSDEVPARYLCRTHQAFDFYHHHSAGLLHTLPSTHHNHQLGSCFVAIADNRVLSGRVVFVSGVQNAKEATQLTFTRSLRRGFASVAVYFIDGSTWDAR